MNKTRRRVVVTGVGAVSPLGLTAAETWEAICKGESGIGLISRFDTSDFSTRIAGEIKGFEPDAYIEKKELKKMDTCIHYAIAASTMAFENATYRMTESNAHRTGAIIGCGIGGLSTMERYHHVLLDKGPSRVSPFFFPMMLPNMAAGQVAIALGA